MGIPSYAVDEVMRRSDIVEVISAYTQLTPKGSSYMGLCPFHNERTPSFSVSSEKQLFHCFGCGESGNVFGFIMKSENLQFADAVRFLAEKINYELPESKFDKGEAQIREIRAKIFELNKQAARFFYDNLQSKQGAVCAAYLDKRGVSQAIRKRFGLGYSPDKYDALFNFFHTKGVSSDIMKASGLFLYEKQVRDRFRNRLMFPIFSAFDEITGFGARALDNSPAKYLNSPETPVFDKSRNLYAINFARKSKAGEFLLCEGYMDVLALAQAGYKGAVAALGTAFNRYHASVLARFTKKCVLVFDSDEAGIKAALRAIPVLESSGIQVRVLSLKGAKDPDEFIKAYGAEAFAKAVELSVSSVLFRIECIKAKFDIDTPEGKASFGTEAARFLAEKDNAVVRNTYAAEVAKIAGLDTSAVISEINKVIKPDGAQFTYKRKQTGKGAEKAEKCLIICAASYPEAALAIKKALPEVCFSNDVHKKLFKFIYDDAINETSRSPAELITEFTDYEEQKTASLVFAEDLPDVSDSLALVLTQLIREVLTSYYEAKSLENGKQGDIAALNEINKKRAELKDLTVEL